jgi:HD-GYP domain-containing protein (c-di-GMP phosphodiesterase class II)
MSMEEARLELAGAFLRELAKARQSATLYPAGHPERLALGNELLQRVRALQDRTSPQHPSLFVDRGGFYLGPTLLPRESLALGKLAEDLERTGVESLTFAEGIGAEHLDRLLSVLAGDPLDDHDLGGLRINVVRPLHRDEDQWEERLRELRRAYAGGITALRGAASRVAAGEPVDLAGASTVVSRLHDEVERDPGYGLLLSAVKSYDEYTYFHMVNVCLLSVALGQLIGLRRDQVMVLGLGGLLHDIGKVYVPHDVLMGTGRLDEEGWRLVQRHPVDGAGLLLSTGDGLYHPAASILLEHHAAYDRSGYPDLHDHGPSVPSRLVAVADSFDAVTSKRSYRDPLDRHGALELLASAAGHGLDPRAVVAFQRLLGRFPIGSLVRLTNGETAVVVRQDGKDPARPTVLVLLDRSGSPVPVEERELAAQPEPAPSIAARVDPEELGIDLPRFVVSGQLHELPARPTPGRGLVHEPAPGEAAPADYVDTHAEGHGHDHDDLDGRPDPDVAPPF